jgi:hypothetical protein
MHPLNNLQLVSMADNIILILLLLTTYKVLILAWLVILILSTLAIQVFMKLFYIF